jgi:hypothetical protein
MDRESARRILGGGLLFASIAVAVFGLTFLIAMLYIAQ